MPIPAQRFQFLNDETNIAVSDFFLNGNDAVLNSPINDLKDISSQLQEFLGNGIQDLDIQSKLSAITDNEFVRSTKDMLPDLQDITSFLPKDISSMLSELIPSNPLAFADLNSLSSKCKNRALSRRGSGRPYGSSNNCNGNSRPASSKCNSNSFNSAIGRATNGSYNGSFINNDMSLNNLMSLSSLGYDMSMCGVFGSLSSMIPNKNIVSRASGSLLGSLSSSKNVLGMMDLANSSAGLHTLLENPAGITNMLTGFIFPKEVRQRDSSSLSDRYTGAMEILDTSWNRSKHDGMLSTRGVSNKNMSKLLRSRNMDNVYTENELDVVPTDDRYFLSLAY